MRTSEFDYILQPDLIAQSPAPERDASRLMVLHRESARVEHRQFRELPGLLRAGDVLVLNNSRVIPARLRGVNARTGGKFEILLLEENESNDWWVMLRPGKRARVGTQITLLDTHGNLTRMHASVSETNAEGHRRLIFDGTQNIAEALTELGEVPLPPYITRANAHGLDDDQERYQTVFAEHAGSIAAPTAGLHFTEPLLEAIRGRGVSVHFITLHVGLGTFAPVKAETLAAHAMHEERYEIDEATARAVNLAKAEHRRVIAVGTTSVRVLESAFGVPASGSLPGEISPKPSPRHEPLNHGVPPLPALSPAQSGGEGGRLVRRGLGEGGRPGEGEVHGECTQLREGGVPNTQIVPGSGRTRIFIHPPYVFRIVDALLTNFHLPRSTLLMLVSAFAAPGRISGREMILSAYAEAIRERYRFFSYGDAMVIV